MDWSSLTPSEKLRKLQSRAELWRDPEYKAREAAVESLMEKEARLSEEEIAFAINQAMARLVDLAEWPSLPAAKRVGLSGSVRHPTACFDLICLAMGYDMQLVVDLEDGLPAFVVAWLADLEPVASSLVREVKRTSWPEVEFHVRYVAEKESPSLKESAPANNHQSPGVVDIPPQYGIAVIDGNESGDEREGLAEDALLFTGFSNRSVKLIWAPSDLEPDAYLESFAALRGVFPSPEDLAGRLEMNRAFMEAQDQPHAYAEDLSFLLSKGDPEVQQAGHVRWVPWDHLEEVNRWLKAHQKDVGWVVRRAGFPYELHHNAAEGEPGQAHRPSFLELDGGAALIEGVG